MSSLSSSRALGLAITIAGLLAFAVPAQASASTGSDRTEHSSFDPTGAVFTCDGGDITVTGGTVDQVTRSGQDSNGGFHFTETLTTHDVTAQDANGAQYMITGASHVAGKVADEELQLITDITHFVIRGVTGGVYGKVQLVDHYNLGGRSFTLEFGACDAPER